MESRRTKIRSVGILSGFFFMINFVVGTGFLSVPYAFYHAGVVSGAVTLIVLSFISWNTANWIVETMARAQVSRVYGYSSHVCGMAGGATQACQAMA